PPEGGDRGPGPGAVRPLGHPRRHRALLHHPPREVRTRRGAAVSWAAGARAHRVPHEIDEADLLLPPAVRVYLAPGRLYASAGPVQVTTILGSCVAVCLWDAHERVGGINH